MYFEIVGTIANIQVIATGKGVREITRLQKFYGKARWRKLKGIAMVRLPSSSLCKAELHWYEAHGIGKKELKIKRILED